MRVTNTFGLNPVLNSEYFIPLLFTAISKSDVPLYYTTYMSRVCRKIYVQCMYMYNCNRDCTSMNTVHGRNKLCRIVQNFHGAKFLQIGKMQNFATTKCLVIVLVTSTTKYFMKNIFVNAIQLVKFT